VNGLKAAGDQHRPIPRSEGVHFLKLEAKVDCSHLVYFGDGLVHKRAEAQSATTQSEQVAGQLIGLAQEEVEVFVVIPVQVAM